MNRRHTSSIHVYACTMIIIIIIAATSYRSLSLSLSLSLSPTHLLIEKNTRNKMIVLEAGRHAKKQNECRCPSVWGASSAISSTKQDQDENPGIAKSLVTIVDLRCVCVRSIFYAILNLIQKKYIHIIFKSNFEKNRENLSPKQKVWLWWTNK